MKLLEKPKRTWPYFYWLHVYHMLPKRGSLPLRRYVHVSAIFCADANRSISFLFGLYSTSVELITGYAFQIDYSREAFYSE